MPTHYLPTIRPDLSDRLLWWIAAVASYFLIVGVASMIVAASRRNTFGLTEKNRRDQFAGFGLGVVKGLIIAAFAVAGIQEHGEPYLAKVDWAQDQTKRSVAWEWSEKYQPAWKIWTSQPVQLFVSHVQKNGLNPPVKGEKPVKESAEPAEKPVQTASRTPKLAPPRHGWPADRVRQPAARPRSAGRATPERPLEARLREVTRAVSF